MAKYSTFKDRGYHMSELGPRTGVKESEEKEYIVE
jgi:hypothetical protein